MNGLIYDIITHPVERFALAALRERILRPLTGDIVDVGAGTGANFRHYNARAQVLALEPDPRMFARAMRRRGTCAAAIELVGDDDSYLDRLPAASADAAVVTLVLCTASDPHRLVSRIRRVLKPTGVLAVLEHVRSGGTLGALQDRVTPLWSRLADGCRLNRDTLELLHGAGFDAGGIEQRRVPGGLIRDVLVGYAR